MTVTVGNETGGTETPSSGSADAVVVVRDSDSVWRGDAGAVAGLPAADGTDEVGAGATTECG